MCHGSPGISENFQATLGQGGAAPCSQAPSFGERSFHLLYFLPLCKVFQCEKRLHFLKEPVNFVIGQQSHVCIL